MSGIDTIIKVSGTVLANATSDGIASIDIPEDGKIVCVGGAILGIYTTAIAAATITLQLSSELSFLSSNQIGVNDARGMIAGIAVSTVIGGLATMDGIGGGKLSEMGDICPGDGIIVNAGERIHLHGFSNSVGLTATATFMLYMSTAGGGRRAPKRR